MLQGKTQIRQDSAKYIRIAVLVIYDIMAVFLAEVLSIWTRFDFSLKSEQGIPFLETAMHYVWLNIITTLIVFAIMHLYNSLWQYASVQELLNVVIACLLGSALQSVGMHMLQWSMPRSYYILYFFFCWHLLQEAGLFTGRFVSYAIIISGSLLGMQSQR